MFGNGRITSRQFSLLVTLYMIGSSILLLPSAFSAKAGQDAWLAAILGIASGALLVMLYNALGSSFPNMTLAEYNEVILGKWLGKLVSLLFFSYLFLTSALVLRNVGDFLVMHMLDSTPIEVIELFFLMVVFVGGYYGLETISRSAEFLFPLVFMLFSVLILLISPQIEVKNIQPVLENGIKPIINGALPFLGTPAAELIAFLIIFPYVTETKGAKKGFLVGYFIGSLVLLIITLVTTLVIGAPLASKEIYPSFHLALKIDVADFFQRIEALLAILWIITIFFKLMICFFAAVLCLAQTWNLKEYRFLNIPLGVILIVLSLIAYPNSTYFVAVIGSIWTPYSLIYGCILPVVLLGVSKLRKALSR